MTKATWYAVRTHFGWWAITTGEVQGSACVMYREDAEQAAEWLNHYRHFAS